MKTNKIITTNLIARFRATPTNIKELRLVVAVPTPSPWDDHAFEAVLDQGRVIAHTTVSRGLGAPCLHGAATGTRPKPFLGGFWLDAN